MRSIINSTVQLGLILLLQIPASTLAQSYAVLHYFDGSDGAHPRRLVLSGATLYGAATYGGSSDYGTLFSVNTDGSGFTVLKNFMGDAEGGYPLGALLVSDTTLYGTAQAGGLGGNGGGGTVFKLNADGTGFQVLHRFTYGSDAFWPETGLVQSGTTLYGTTEVSSPYYGTVFKLNTDGSGYQLLKSLGTSDGANPRGELLLSGSILYGTTSGHAYPGSGTIFKLNTNGSGFTILKELTLGGDMYRLFSPLVESGGTLYGTACQDNSYGVVFKINTDRTGFTVLQTITNVNGAWEWPGVAGPVLVGTALYATSGGRPN
jgi:uncharacterized repeat protein (TIGR03803 family)